MAAMSDFLVCYVCEVCGEEFYFTPESLPGGEEHCEYCEVCCGKLIREDMLETTDNDGEDNAK
jgi:hypothetical protein